MAIARQEQSSSAAITLSDGTLKVFDRPVSGADIAASIGPGLAKAALAVKVDGEVRDLDMSITGAAGIEIITRKSDEAL